MERDADSHGYTDAHRCEILALVLQWGVVTTSGGPNSYGGDT